jgi:hypothetical protein
MRSSISQSPHVVEAAAAVRVPRELVVNLITSLSFHFDDSVLEDADDDDEAVCCMPPNRMLLELATSSGSRLLSRLTLAECGRRRRLLPTQVPRIIFSRNNSHVFLLLPPHIIL